MSLLRLYIDMYCESKYKNRIHISDLYVKLWVADHRKENVNNIVKIMREILDNYNKLYDLYVIDKNLPPVDSDFFWIFQHHIEHNGVEPSKRIKIKID
jgi:hypothetical protein